MLKHAYASQKNTASNILNVNIQIEHSNIWIKLLNALSMPKNALYIYIQMFKSNF